MFPGLRFVPKCKGIGQDRGSGVNGLEPSTGSARTKISEKIQDARLQRLATAMVDSSLVVAARQGKGNGDGKGKGNKASPPLLKKE